MFKETIISKLSAGLNGEELSLFQAAAKLTEDVEGKSLVETLTELRESGLEGYKAVIEEAGEYLDEDINGSEEEAKRYGPAPSGSIANDYKAQYKKENEDADEVEEGPQADQDDKRKKAKPEGEKTNTTPDGYGVGSTDDDDDDNDDDKEDVKEENESYSSIVKRRLDDIIKIDETYGSCCDESEISVSEDVDAMFAGADLTEEFKDKATMIFEAAVARQVNLQVSNYKSLVEEAIDDLVEEEVIKVTEELTGKIDQYLDYVVEEWMEENKLAIETGIRTDVAEGFIAGLKNLFIENYIEVPEGKEDILVKVSEEKIEIEEEFELAIQRNIELAAENKDLKKGIIISEMTKGLADTQAEKLTQLSESVDFEGTQDFAKKVSQIRESYFNTPAPRKKESISIDEEQFILEEDSMKVTNKKMSTYVDTLSKYLK